MARVSGFLNFRRTGVAEFTRRVTFVFLATAVGLLVGVYNERSARNEEQLAVVWARVGDLEAVIRLLAAEQNGGSADKPLVITVPPDPATGRPGHVIVVPGQSSSTTRTTPSTTTTAPRPTTTTSSTTMTQPTSTTSTTSTTVLAQGCVADLPCVTVGAVPSPPTTVPSRLLPSAVGWVPRTRTPLPTWRTPVTWTVQREENP